MSNRLQEELDSFDKIINLLQWSIMLFAASFIASVCSVVMLLANKLLPGVIFLVISWVLLLIGIALGKKAEKLERKL